MASPSLRVLGVVASLLVVSIARAQTPSPVALAERLEKVRMAQTVASMVVITEDPRSYLDAISGWRRDVRYPVLYDDGSALSAQRIGMFVRAFGPDRIVRHVASDTTWAEQEEPRRVLIEEAVCNAWQLESNDTRALLAYFELTNWKSPGIVVSSLRDRAWTGAVATAAGRGLPICWVVAPRNVNGAMTEAEADALCSTIEVFCARTNLSWRALGDDLEAIALCLNCPVKIRRDATDDHIATTDRMGRLVSDVDGDGRWAWAGQIIGDESEAAFRAMCALFLTVDRAWLFDGYDDDPSKVWHHWDVTEASRNLALRNIQSTIFDTPNQSLDIWRLAATRPVEGGLLLVNSSGSPTTFNLRPGKGNAGDMPILQIPAAMHIVHSWSAVRPGARLTIAGRLLERGV
ncbi:MAG: hypothetical protein KDA28_05715, partial [Phycisphaerales bacterium]|nr:hypothetical protein [Phycisphaerales bacterium]